MQQHVFFGQIELGLLWWTRGGGPQGLPMSPENLPHFALWFGLAFALPILRLMTANLMPTEGAGPNKVSG